MIVFMTITVLLKGAAIRMQHYCKFPLCWGSWQLLLRNLTEKCLKCMTWLYYLCYC